MKIQFESACASRRGHQCDRCEDASIVRSDLALFAVIDGSGISNRAGLSASLVAKSVENYFEATMCDPVEQVDRFGIMTQSRRLARAIQKANADLIEIAQKYADHRPMLASVVAVHLRPQWRCMYVAHVGNCRCYRVRQHLLEPLTQDHSLLNDVTELRPEIDDEVLELLPLGIVTRGLGMVQRVRVQLSVWQISPGDRFLLCSDGLYQGLALSVLSRVLRQPFGTADLVEELVTKAQSERNADNATAIVIDCWNDEDAMTGPESAATTITSASSPEILLRGIETDDLVTAMVSVEQAQMVADEDRNVSGIRQAVENWVSTLRPEAMCGPVDLTRSMPCTACEQPVPPAARFCPFCGTLRRA